MQVAVADDHAAEAEAPVRIFAHSITQLMEHHRGIYKVIQPACFADRGRLKKFMPLISAAGAIWFTGSYKGRSFLNCHHIRPQDSRHRSAPACITNGTKTGIQIGAASLCNHSRVELRLVPLSFSQPASILIVDISIKLIFSRRGIADRNGDAAFLIQHIVEIIPPVRPSGDIGSIQAHAAVLIKGIVCFFVYDPFIPPIAQIPRGGRPAYIVVEAVRVAVEPVMGAIYIYSIFKYMRLSVGNILPRRQIWIERLSFHTKIPPHRFLYSRGRQHLWKCHLHKGPSIFFNNTSHSLYPIRIHRHQL